MSQDFGAKTIYHSQAKTSQRKLSRQTQETNSSFFSFCVKTNYWKKIAWFSKMSMNFVYNPQSLVYYLYSTVCRRPSSRLSAKLTSAGSGDKKHKEPWQPFWTSTAMANPGKSIEICNSWPCNCYSKCGFNIGSTMFYSLISWYAYWIWLTNGISIWRYQTQTHFRMLAVSVR